MSETATNPGERYCLFRSGTSWFALPAAGVREVCFRPDIVPVSSSAPVLAGLCHFRNEFLSVLSLRRLLPTVAQTASAESQMLIVEGDESDWALLVDEVAALECLDASVAGGEGTDEDWADVVMAWATFRDHSVRILDGDTFYRLAADALQDGWIAAVHSGLMADKIAAGMSSEAPDNSTGSLSETTRREDES